MSCSRQITRELQPFSLNCILYQNFSNTVRVIVTSKKAVDIFINILKAPFFKGHIIFWNKSSTIFLKQEAKQLMKRKLMMQLKLKMSHLKHSKSSKSSVVLHFILWKGNEMRKRSCSNDQHVYAKEYYETKIINHFVPAITWMFSAILKGY